jgi:hypothetical protein
MREPRNFFDSPRFDNQRSNQKTLRDLDAADGRLIAVCKRCLNRSEIKPEEAITTLGHDFPLFGLRKVLRCRRCRVRGLANVHEVWP